MSAYRRSGCLAARQNNVLSEHILKLRNIFDRHWNVHRPAGAKTGE
jgi:hypothetical protein